ncbi:MAG: SDR family NAD(P)-dependent oxidoreductase [Halomonas sp.]|uniref:SDR family NAD(P)-dependent oxidoreductase n=1 Tax=Halomonas sp. AOP42-C1-46 TaxID=3457671 RepID=UPI003FB876AE
MDNQFLSAMFGLQGQTVLVTGGASGLGLSIATTVGKAGGRVIVNDIRDEVCNEAIERLQAQGIDAQAAVFDVSCASAVSDAMAKLSKDGWTPDVLVSNAGNQNRGPVIEQEPEAWQSIFDVHVNGAFNCVRGVLPGMISQGKGRIIIMSSVAAIASMPGIAAYSAAKGALAAFTRALAVEYGSLGITCNALAPGFVRTGFTTELQEREQFETFLKAQVPLGRWAEPEDVAPAILYLASQAGEFVNGHVLAIDGGLLAHM